MNEPTLQVEFGESFTPPDVRVTIVCGGPLTAEQRERLDKLVDAWYWVGSYGGFGGFMHFADESVHGTEHEKATVEWLVDLGNAGEGAIEALRRLLEGFATTEGVKIERLVLG